MTTLDPTPPTAGRATATHPTYRLTMRRVVNSEWIKIRTLRSTWVGMIAIIAIFAGFAAISASVSSNSTDGPSDPFSDGSPLSTVLGGANFAVLLVAVLGCLTGAREYISRMISATVGAVPRRWQVLASKTIALTAVILPTALVAVAGAFAVGMTILSRNGGITVSLTDDGVITQLVGMAGYVCAIALIAFALGVILRSVSGSIGAMVAGILILPGLAGNLLPDSWGSLLQFLPSSAAAAFTTVSGSGDRVLSAGAGVAVLVAWVAVALAGAVIVMRRRDV